MGTPASTTRTLLHASWASVGLGLAFEGLQLAAVGLSGGSTPPVVAAIADTAQKVSWSYVVCVPLAVGTVASRARPAAVGALGLLAAPLAFSAARVVHKSVGEALSASVPAGGPDPWLLAGLKGLEYALLGWLVGRLILRPEPRLAPYLRAGFIVGALFGGLILWLMIRAAPPAGLSTPALVGRAVNEVLFPASCALLLWVTEQLVRRPA